MAYARVQTFLTANQTLAINSTTDLTGVTRELKVNRDDGAALYLYVKGDNAACALDVDFYFQRSPDGTNWHDLDVLSVTLDGTSQVVDNSTTIDMDLSNTRYIRLARATNNETVAGRTAAVNAYMQLKG